MSTSVLNSWLSSRDNRHMLEDDLFLALVAEEIAKQMNKKGITKADLARRMNVSPPYITKLLKGDTNMSILTIFKISQHIGEDININDLRRKSRSIIEEQAEVSNKTICPSSSDIFEVQQRRSIPETKQIVPRDQTNYGYGLAA